MKKPLVLSIALALTACGGSSNNNNDSKDPSGPGEPGGPAKPPVAESPLAALKINCQTVTQAAQETNAGLLQLNLVDSHVSGNEFDTASAEIVSYDTCSDRLYVVNAQDATVDVLSLAANNSAPAKAGTINLATAATSAGIEIGAANSVSAKQGLVAVAIEAKVKQNPGLIALYRSDDLSLLATFPAGALPDMVALSDDARYILSANEGEPSGDYKNDPEGSITLIDLLAGFESGRAVVKQIDFKEFNTGAARADELGDDVRTAGPTGTTVAQDLEPEYLTINADASKAYVALQENNALATIDIASASIESIKGFGEKSWAVAELDASNEDKAVGNFASYDQLVGLYMPDTITSFEKDGETFIVSANEGDGREYVYETTQKICDEANHEWDGDDFAPGGKKEDAIKYENEEDDCISFIDETRGGDLYDDATIADAHPLKEALDDNDQLKRLKFVTDDMDIAADETLKSFGTRSFSIWNEQGDLVFDSGDDLAKKAFAADNNNFNTTNDNNDTGETADDRSDDKGIEPEAVEVAEINGRIFIFVGLERQGGVMIYDATNPQAPVFQSYINNRDFTEGVCTEVDDGDCDNDVYNIAAGDLGPESIDYFSRENKHFIAVGNEVSGTTTVYEISFLEWP
jgi:DNA-binding beta-propeller fold protein YncE